MTNTVRQKVLLIFTLNLFSLAGCSEGETGSAKKAIIEHTAPVTVQPTKEQPIQQSPAFSLRWEKQISGVEDLSFPVGSLHSRVPITHLTSLSRGAIELISFDSGEVTGSSKLPVEIASIHKDERGDKDFSDFSYSLLGTPDDGVLVVSATLSRLYSDGSGSGFATAIYGCSFDGEISWCAKVGLTHSMVATSLRSGEDLLLVEEDDKLLLGITPSGQEAFRVKLPSYDSLVLQRTSSGELCLLIIGSSISCYEFR
jgi:hypothetical protein